MSQTTDIPISTRSKPRPCLSVLGCSRIQFY